MRWVLIRFVHRIIRPVGTLKRFEAVINAIKLHIDKRNAGDTDFETLLSTSVKIPGFSALFFALSIFVIVIFRRI
jgi:hypothetical protein